MGSAARLRDEDATPTHSDTHAQMHTHAQETAKI